MGCNCKKQFNKMLKYADKGEEDNEKEGLLVKIIQYIMGMGFGIIVAALFIVIVIPLLAYIIICVIFGLEPHIRILDIRKRIIRLKHGREE